MLRATTAAIVPLCASFAAQAQPPAKPPPQAQSRPLPAFPDALLCTGPSTDSVRLRLQPVMAQAGRPGAKSQLALVTVRDLRSESAEQSELEGDVSAAQIRSVGGFQFLAYKNVNGMRIALRLSEGWVKHPKGMFRPGSLSIPGLKLSVLLVCEKAPRL